MSVSTEITRIKNAKSAISTAITNKGVSVPSGTKLDGMAALIGNIQQGSSLSTSTLSTGSAVGGTTYYIDKDGQGQQYCYFSDVECLKGSYFVADYAGAADGLYCSGCEVVKTYGPVATTTDDSPNYLVVICKVTGDNASTMF